MKKIFTFILLSICLQNGFCNNIPNIITGNNDELVHKMSKDKDVIRFFKLALAKKLSEEIKVENAEKGIKISIEDKAEFEKLCSKTIIALETVIKKYPELDMLTLDKKIDVIRASAVLSFAEIIVCLATPIGGICGSVTKIEAAILTTCLGVCGAVDVLIAYFSGGTATAPLLGVVTTQTTYCATIAKGSAWAACIVTAFSTVVVCLQNEAAD